MDRTKEIYKVTLWGSLANMLLVVVKFVAGVVGSSAAMIADAVHSLSDFLTDIIVLVFVKLSSRPADEDHNYGYGKYETLATLIVGGSLLVVGGKLLADGVHKIVDALHGEILQSPGWIAFAAAILSIIIKEVLYQVTVRVGKNCKSDVVVANAWHHRTDALSSVGTALGIGGAVFFGQKWALLDPLAAAVVSIFIIVAAVKILLPSLSQLTETSLPAEEEDVIRRIVAEDAALSDLHHLRTRHVGNVHSVDMHVRMDGNVSLNEAHRHSMELEHRLKEELGPESIINIHIEPLKINGEYE